MGLQHISPRILTAFLEICMSLNAYMSLILFPSLISKQQCTKIAYKVMRAYLSLSPVCLISLSITHAWLRIAARKLWEGTGNARTLQFMELFHNPRQAEWDLNIFDNQKGNRDLQKCHHCALSRRVGRDFQSNFNLPSPTTALPPSPFQLLLIMEVFSLGCVSKLPSEA